MVRMCKSNNYFPYGVRPSVRPASVHLSVRLFSKPWGGCFYQTSYMTSPHDKGVGEQFSPSVMLLATLAKSVGICDDAPSTARSSCFCFKPKYLSLLTSIYSLLVFKGFFSCCAYISRYTRILFCQLTSLKETIPSESFQALHL